MVSDWFADARVLRLGYALIHFLWQGALVVFVAAAMLHFLRNAASSRRYAVLLGLFLVMALMPLLTFLASMPGSKIERDLLTNRDHVEPRLAAVPDDQDEPTTAPTATPQAVSRPAVTVSMEGLTPVASHRPSDRWLLVLVAAWAFGVALCSLRLIVGWASVLRIQFRGLTPAPARIQSFCSTLCDSIPVRRTVRICESVLVQVPAVVGWMRPMILLPAQLVTGLSEDELRAVLAHELAHIRRHDYVVNVMQIVVENVLFYHPAVWWLSRRIRQEREHCCDDIAAAACGGKAIVAKTLATLAELHAAAPYALPAATGGSLVPRIRRLIQSEPQPSRLASGGLGISLLVGILITFVVMIINFSRLASADNAVADEPPKSQPGTTVEHFANNDVVAVHSDGIMAIAFSPDGQFLAGGGMDGNARIWDSQANRLLRTLKGPKRIVRAVDISTDGSIVAGGCDDGLIYLWDAANGEVKRTLKSGVDTLNSLAFSPDGNILASGGHSIDASANKMFCEVLTWDWKTGIKQRTILQEPGGVDGLAFSPDGNMLAAALASHTKEKAFSGIKVWNPVTGEETARLVTDNALPHALAFSPDGKLLAHGGGFGKIVDGTMRPFPESRLWDVSTGREVRRFSGTGVGYYFCVKFSPDGKYLATGSDGPIVEYVDGRSRGKKVLSETQLWNVATGELIWKAQEGLGRVNAIVFSPSGKTIAICDNESARLLSAETGKTQHVLMKRTLGPVKSEDDATMEDETSKYGRPLNNEEKLEALELIAETKRANFDRTQSWTGAYQFHDRLRFWGKNPGLPENMLIEDGLLTGQLPPLNRGEMPTGKDAGGGHFSIDRGIATFSLDNVGGRLSVFYDPDQPVGFVDVETGRETHWKTSGTDIHWLFMPEHSLEFEPSSKRGQISGYPRIESLPGSTRVVYRYSTLHGQRFNGRTVDPRTLFSDISNPSWEHCELYASALRGERRDKDRLHVESNCTIYVNSELPPTYTEVTTMKNGSELITVYDGKAAFNVVEYTQTGKDGLHRQHKTKYSKVSDIHIPDTYERSHYNVRDGKNILMSVRSLQLVHATLNGEIPESEFTMEPFQLKYGERLVDEIENRLKVYDELIGFVPAEGFVYDPIRLGE